jgi:hypothetical protein
MSIGKAKNILGKATFEKISHRMAVLRELTGKSPNTLGKEAGLSNATADDWSDNQIVKPTRAVEDFLTHHHIRMDWWKTGEGEVFKENGTYVEIPTPMNKPEKNGHTTTPADEVLRHLIKGDSDYILINKELILEKYRLVSLEEIEEQKKESQRKHDEILRDLEERKNQIHGLYKIIQDITAKIPDPDSNKAVLDKAQ